MIKFETPNLIIPQERGQEIEVMDTFFLTFDENDGIRYHLKNGIHLNFGDLAKLIENFLEDKEELPPYDSIVVLSIFERTNSEEFEVTFDLIRYKDSGS